MSDKGGWQVFVMDHGLFVVADEVGACFLDWSLGGILLGGLASLVDVGC